jgi:hypothetical protein
MPSPHPNTFPSSSTDPPPPAYQSGPPGDFYLKQGESARWSNNSQGPPTELPNIFPIGEHILAPVVTIAELQQHLRILGAFYQLRQMVTAAASWDADPIWAAFVNRAVHRFNLWAQTTSIMVHVDSDSLPPIDVLMVWHAYMLVSS